MKRGLFAVGATVLMLVGLLAAVGGSASAAPMPASAPAATTAWAYGGSNSSSGSYTVGNYTVSWSVSVSADVIFNATPNGPNTTELEAQRTLGISIVLTLSAGKAYIQFSYHGTEADTAYANITNASTVYVHDLPVKALGIENSAVHGHAALAESLVASGIDGQSASAYLNVSGKADAQVAFTPALGVVPLNLTGVSAWNSTAIANPSADWTINYSYAFHGWNDTSASGSSGHSGSWTATGPVELYGQVLTLGIPQFHDHAPRLGVLLSLSGPAHLYDGFIVIPRGFDLFGGARHDYNNESMSNVTISQEPLFLTKGHVRATSLTASELVVGGAGGSVPLAVPGARALPAASGIGNSVVEQPESVAAAQSQSHCIEYGCAGTPWFSGLIALVVIGGVIAAVAGTAGVIEWRSYARRKNRSNQLVGGYSETMARGTPPAAAPSPTSLPSAPGGPANDLGPGRLP